MRIVIDTNVVLDMFHFDDPAAVPIRTAIEAKTAVWVSDADCRAELLRVLAYPAFGLDAAGIARIIACHDALATSIPTAPPPPGTAALPRCRDPDDQKFLILAQRADAALLISKDKELLRLARRATGFCIVTPAAARAFLIA